MLSLHFNGDVIRHPDSAANYARRMSGYDQQRRCKYGVKEWECPVYMAWLLKQDKVKRASEYPRCFREGSEIEIRDDQGRPVKDLPEDITPEFIKENQDITKLSECPKKRRLQMLGTRKKKFRITSRHYRMLASAGHLMLKTAKNKAVFFTLTFPKYKRDVTEQEHNEYFSKYMENLRRNYSLNAYIAVRERGEIGGRLHYHVIADMPFINYGILNDVWINTISFICNYSNCALQTDKGKSVIYDTAGSIRYMCKYFTKARGQESDSRLIFIGGIRLFNKIEEADPETGEIYTRKESTIKKTMPGNWEDFLPEYKNVRIRHEEFITMFTIMDRDEFKRFCSDVLYPFFDLSINKAPPLRVGQISNFF